MCGIIGYIGQENAIPILLDGLSRLEYRGYDSSGISIVDQEGKLKIFKKVGKLDQLKKFVDSLKLKSCIGLGHTRWATHGPPSDQNAHPHQDCSRSIAVVHNGIIENFHELREDLKKKHHRFRSETDTEVIAHLIEEELKKGGGLEEALRRTLRKVRGAYALGVIRKEEEGTLVAARKGSPLVIGLGENENFIASDVSALLKKTRRVIYLQDEQIAFIQKNRCEIKTLSGQKIHHVVDRVFWKLEEAEKGGFDRFMLKEINEQPEILKNVWMGRVNLKKGTVHFEEEALTDRQAK
jgi:glucosamine--fructose-6-phosphate aminotransferase (isomerizing)